MDDICGGMLISYKKKTQTYKPNTSLSPLINYLTVPFKKKLREEERNSLTRVDKVDELRHDAVGNGLNLH